MSEDLKRIKGQIKLLDEALENCSKQNAIFDEVLTKTIKGVPEEQKKDILRVQSIAQRAINMAKNGDVKGAESLLKDLKNGS